MPTLNKNIKAENDNLSDLWPIYCITYNQFKNFIMLLNETIYAPPKMKKIQQK